MRAAAVRAEGEEFKGMAKTCAQCGAIMASGDVFCGECGHRAPAGAVTVADQAPADVMSPTSWPGVQWPGAEAPVTPSAGQSASSTVDAALGQATPNATYLGQRLLYDKTPETPFDPITNNRILFQMVRQWFLYWIVLWVGGFVSAVFCFVLSLGAGPNVGITLWTIGGVITSFTLACLFWLIPQPALLSEWKFAVDGQGAAAPIVFDHIAWALGRHATPLDSLQVRRLRLAGEGQRDYLELRRSIFTGYVACFGYGNDLYVGWTFWVRLSPFRWLMMVIARIWQSLTHHGNDIYTTLRYDGARAMREAMHSTTREGVDVAVGQLAPQGQGLVGSAIPVTEVTE